MGTLRIGRKISWVCALVGVGAAYFVPACVGDEPASSGQGGSDSGSDGTTTGDGSGGGDGAPEACSGVTCGSDTCVDLKSDPNNCGTCGTVCASADKTSFACVSGICGNKVTQVSAGSRASCAVLLDGNV